MYEIMIDSASDYVKVLFFWCIICVIFMRFLMVSGAIGDLYGLLRRPEFVVGGWNLVCCIHGGSSSCFLSNLLLRLRRLALIALRRSWDFWPRSHCNGDSQFTACFCAAVFFVFYIKKLIFAQNLVFQSGNCCWRALKLLRISCLYSFQSNSIGFPCHGIILFRYQVVLWGIRLLSLMRVSNMMH